MEMIFDLIDELPPGIYEVELNQYKTRQWLIPETSEPVTYLDFEFLPVDVAQGDTVQFSCPKQERGSRSKLAKLVKSLLPGTLGKIQLDDLLQRRMQAEVSLNERGYLEIQRHWPLETPQDSSQSERATSQDRSPDNNTPG